MSSSTISATRRSRNDFDACETAAEAAASHDSVLVPMSSTTVYTLSAMTASLVRLVLAHATQLPGSDLRRLDIAERPNASGEIGTFRIPDAGVLSYSAFLLAARRSRKTSHGPHVCAFGHPSLARRIPTATPAAT